MTRISMLKTIRHSLESEFGLKLYVDFINFVLLTITFAGLKRKKLSGKLT